MIVRFTLTPQSLHLLGVEERRRPKVLRKIVNIWGRLGRMVVLNGVDGERALFAELEKLPQTLRKNWKMALGRFGVTTISYNIVEPAQMTPDLLADLAEFIEVFGAAPEELLLIPEGSSLRPEPVLSCELDEAETFASAAENADRNIPEGMLVATIWKNQLHPLIDASKKILIIDRYGISKFQKNNKYFESAGLRVFIKELGEYSGKHMIVYAGFDDINDGEMGQQMIWQETCACLDSLNEEFNSDRQNRIEIKAIPDSFFKKVHDRFIAFDYQVLELGSGLEVFSGPKTWRGATCSLKVKSNGHVQLIQDLKLRSEKGFKWFSHK